MVELIWDGKYDANAKPAAPLRVNQQSGSWGN